MIDTLDSVLQRQLRRAGLSHETPPTDATWTGFLGTVNDHYVRVRDDRTMLMRSMDLSTGEMEELRRQVESQRDALSSLLGSVSEAIDSFGHAVHQQRIGKLNQDSSGDTVGSIRVEFSARLSSLFKLSEQTAEVSAIRTNLFRLADQLVSLLSGAAAQGEAVKELEVARAAQQLLMPNPDLDCAGLKIASIFEPAAACSGDFWSIQALPEDRTMVVVGDVTGHGAASAILTGVAKGVCETYVRNAPIATASGLLVELNRVILSVAQTKMMMSCSVAIYDAKTKQLSVASAGHPAPIHIRGQVARPVPAQGALLGGTREPHYETTVHQLESSDTLVWFTDGLIEVEDARHEQFGERRLRAICQREASPNPAQLRDALNSGFREHLSGGIQPDDVTVVVLAVA